MNHTRSLLTETRESLAIKLAASFSAAYPEMDADTAAAKAEATLVTVKQLLMKRSGLAPATMTADQQTDINNRTVGYFNNCKRGDLIALAELRPRMIRSAEAAEDLAISQRGVSEDKAHETLLNSLASIEALGLPPLTQSRPLDHAKRPKSHALRA